MLLRCPRANLCFDLQTHHYRPLIANIPTTTAPNQDLRGGFEVDITGWAHTLLSVTAKHLKTTHRRRRGKDTTHTQYQSIVISHIPTYQPERSELCRRDVVITTLHHNNHPLLQSPFNPPCPHQPYTQDAPPPTHPHHPHHSTYPLPRPQLSLPQADHSLLLQNQRPNHRAPAPGPGSRHPDRRRLYDPSFPLFDD